MNDIFLSPIPLENLLASFREIIENVIQTQLKEQSDDKLLKSGEVCSLFRISSATLRNWCIQGILVKHYIGRKVFYKYTEVTDALKTLKRYQHFPIA